MINIDYNFYDCSELPQTKKGNVSPLATQDFQAFRHIIQAPVAEVGL